jgi:hypothetical protein
MKFIEKPIIKIILKAWILMSSPSITITANILFINTSSDYHVSWRQTGTWLGNYGIFTQRSDEGI